MTNTTQPNTKRELQKFETWSTQISRHTQNLGPQGNFYFGSIVAGNIGSREKRSIPPRPTLPIAVTGGIKDFYVDALSSKKLWRDKEYRHAYAAAAVEQGIAYQVRVNREARSLTQSDLARLIGTKQSSISRMEDPEYGSHSLPTLLKVAEAFDCAVLVKLVPFSVLAAESKRLSVSDLYVASYAELAGVWHEEKSSYAKIGGESND